jgi:hypothetical protein
MEDDSTHNPMWNYCRDVRVPMVHEGILQYRLMELVAPEEPGEYWTVRPKKIQLPVPTTVAGVEMPRHAMTTAGMAPVRY